MKRAQAERAGVRQHRSRPIPKWLLSSSELEATARSRCLMVLSVLSGETPVTDAIVEAKISRNTYYQLETRALQAMLAVLNPLASSSPGRAAGLSAANGRIAKLTRQVQRLEQEKRRLKRLLLLTHKSVCEPMPRRGLRLTVPGAKTPKRRTPGPSCFTRSTTSPLPSDAPSSTPPGAPSP